MDSKHNPNIKNSMNFGTIIGVILVICYVILYLFAFTLNTFFIILMLFILIGGIFTGSISLRDNVYEGYISQKQVIKSGTLIGLFSGIILAFFFYILYAFIDTELLKKSLKVYEQKMLMEDMQTVDTIDYRINILSKILTPAGIALFSVSILTILGFIMSLILSPFIKSESTDEQSEE